MLLCLKAMSFDSAVVWCIQLFRYYLQRSDFRLEVINTDAQLEEDDIPDLTDSISTINNDRLTDHKTGIF